MKRNIGTKLTISFFMVIVLMTVLALYSVNIGQKYLSDSTGRSAIFISDVMLGKINQNIYNYVEEIQMYSKNSTLRQTVSRSNREFEKISDVDEYIKRMEENWNSGMKGENTLITELTNNALANNIREVFIDFYEKRYGHRVFSEVFVTNRFGVNIAQTGKTSDYRQDDESWWQIAREEGFYVSDVEYDSSAGEQAISIGVRIEDEEGNFLGVVKGILSSNTIIREAEINTKKHRTAEIDLITEDGKLIFSSLPFKSMEDISGNEYFEQIDDRTGFFISREGGKEKLFSYVHSRSYKGFSGFPWILVLKHDVNEILTPAFSLRNRVIIVSISLILIGIIIIVFISLDITKPLQKLKEGAERIGKGDLGSRIDMKREDEIGDLADAFNRMSENLQSVTASRDELDREITRRKEGERRLREYSKALKRSNKELEQFAYVASHDLQEPLRMISSYTQLLEKRYRDKLDEEAEDFINYVVDGANRLQQLIQDLLSYSRVTTRGGEFTEVDASSALGEARVNLKKAIEESNAIVSNDELPTVRTDRTQLVRLFQNLIENAIDFSGDESPRIHVSAEKKGEEWVFSVEDNGIGIEQEYQEKIFTIFQQLEDIEKGSGTGIGLSICRRIVKRHGGKIWVESESGEGSTFYFTLEGVES